MPKSTISTYGIYNNLKVFGERPIGKVTKEVNFLSKYASKKTIIAKCNNKEDYTK